MKNKQSTLALVAALLCALALPAAAQPLDQLVLKGTHNSYACCGGESGIWPITWWNNSCPVMHNPLREQMDDWNLWFYELDFGPVQVGSDVLLVIGHDGPTGDDTYTHPDWGATVNGFITLESFLIEIRDSRSFAYRPVFIQFDFKGGEGNWADEVAPGYNTVAATTPLLRALLVNVFGENNLFDPDDLNQPPYNGQWPSAPQLAGKVIPYNIGGCADGSCGLSLPTWFDDGYPNAGDRANAIQDGNRIMKIDYYQQDWTFGTINDGTAPPNPVYVKSGAPEEFVVVNEYGHDCDDIFFQNDVGDAFTVHQHGTFRFPFDTVEESVKRAKPGWTLLIHTGVYPENITIETPLTLKADGGPVTIGQ